MTKLMAKFDLNPWEAIGGLYLFHLVCVSVQGLLQMNLIIGR